MFAYDAQLATVLQPSPKSIPEVLQILHAIDNTCIVGDGLKWFNRLYLQVTQAVEDRVAAGGFHDPAWLSELDVEFAKLYFDALAAALAGTPYPGCWQAFFSRRAESSIARIQFALAGMNAHINRDLPVAIVSTCQVTKTAPQHGTAQYNDYTTLNATLDSLIDAAKRTLNVRLPGDLLPPVSHLEDLLAGWNLSAAREQAWNVAEGLSLEPSFTARITMEAIDGLTTVIGKALLIPVPFI